MNDQTERVLALSVAGLLYLVATPAHSVDSCDGEVPEVYRDGDGELPTICGTGLEDYVGSAWGMSPHTAFYAGVPIQVSAPHTKKDDVEPMPDLVSFYRWHLPDPIIFHETLTATIQQIGFVKIPTGHEDLLQRYTAAGNGWTINRPEFEDQIYAAGLAERQDDYSAAAFVYCRQIQAVPRLDVKAATTDIGLLAYETHRSG